MSLDPEIIAMSKEEHEARLAACPVLDDTWLANARNYWEGSHKLYDQQERMIAALNRLAAALESSRAV